MGSTQKSPQKLKNVPNWKMTKTLPIKICRMQVQQCLQEILLAHIFALEKKKNKNLENK